MPDPIPVSPQRGDAARPVWADRLARFAAAGLKAAAFCDQEGVSLASFYSWKRRLAETPMTTPVSEQPLRLLPVRLASAAPPLELVLPGGAVLRVTADADPTTLATLLRLLGVTPC